MRPTHMLAAAVALALLLTGALRAVAHIVETTSGDSLFLAGGAANRSLCDPRVRSALMAEVTRREVFSR